MPEVSTRYNLSIDPNDRAIGGSSSGAIAAFTVAWQRPDAFRRVLSWIGSYTNLRGGKYIFRVIGSNQDGVWNETGTNVEITVTPPLWESGWFIASLVLVLIGLSIIGYRMRVMGIQAQNRTLEEQIRERTQEIERRREVAEGLRDVLDTLNSESSLEDTLDYILQQSVKLLAPRVEVAAPIVT